MLKLMSFSSSASSSASSPSSSLSPTTYASRLVMSMSVIFVTSIILSFVSVEVTLGAELQKEHRKMSVSTSTTSSSSSSPSSSPARAKRIVRSVDSQSPTPGADSLVDIIDQVENASGNENLLLYTPTTPSPEDVNCYVEVPVTRHVGGRCVNLGSFIGCQAGIYLAFDSACDQRLGALAEGQSADELRARRRNHPFMRNRHSNPFRSRPRS